MFIVEKQKNKMRPDNIASIIVILFFISYLLSQTVDGFSEYISFFIGISGFLFLFKKKDFQTYIQNINIVILFGAFFFLMLISIVYTQNITNLMEVVFQLKYVGVAILLLKYKINPMIIYFSFYTHVLFFTFHILNGTDPNLLMKASRNNVSVVMIIQTSLVYISLVKNNKKITYLPALITFIISLWAIGRSGILSSVFLLIGVLLVSLKIENTKKNMTLNIVLILLLVIFFNIPTNTLNIVDNLSNNYEIAYQRSLSKGLEDRARETILKEYIKEFDMNIMSFFLGVPFRDHSIFAFYNNNLHNSYLRLHAFFGLAGFLMVLIGIAVAMKKYIKQKNILYFFIFGTILLRITTDTLAFTGIMDPLIYYFLINGVSDKLKKKICLNH